MANQNKTGAEIIQIFDKLSGKRANWESYWQSLADFCMPRKAFITRTRTPGEELNFHRVFDSTAIRSAKIMASGFHSNLTNPSSPWFQLEMEDRELNDVKDVKIWLDDAQNEIFSTLNGSNFDEVIQEFYMDDGIFGFGGVMQEEDNETRVRFTSIPIRELHIEEDSKGRVNTVFRRFEYTAQQMFERWGDKAGEAVLKALKDKQVTKQFTVIHAIFQRSFRIEGKIDAQNKPIASIWVEKEKKIVLQEGGFDEMPIHVGRFWKTAGEIYGYSPAMDVLPDIKLVNSVRKSMLRATQKIVDPPGLLRSRGVMLPLNLNPGQMNLIDGQVDDVRKAYQAIKTEGNIPIGFDFESSIREIIREGFFVPLFQAFAHLTKQMTIPEVQRRIQENMILLGPVVGRMQNEILSPIILRTFNILFRNGFLADPPEIIQGKEMKLKYISPLALQQRSAEINSLNLTLGTVGEIAQLFPEVIDNINADKAVQLIATINGTDPELLRDKRDVAAIREGRAEQAAADQAAISADQVAQTTKTASEADKNFKEE